MPARRWTPEDIDTLRALAAQGTRPAEIAAMLKVKLSNLRVLAWRNGIKLPRAAATASRPPRKPPAPVDVASRMAALYGEVPLPPMPKAEIADEDLRRYRGDYAWPAEAVAALRAGISRWIVETPKPIDDAVLARVLGLQTFASELCHIGLDTPQLAMAAAVLGSKRTVILAGRRSGKSVALGAIATWATVCLSNSRTVVVASADRQAQEVASRIVYPMLVQDDRLFGSIKNSNKEILECKNGSILRFLPSTGQIRGIGATLLLVDEVRDIQDEELVFSSIEPMLANSNGAMALFSTPWMASGKLWDSWHSGFFSKVKIPSWDSKFVDKEYVENERLQMSHQVFEAELAAEFMESVGTYFSAQAIQKCLRHYGLREVREAGRTYSLGVDFGRFRDQSVFCVVSRGDEDGHMRVDWLKPFTDIPLSDQRPYAFYLNRTFNFTRAVVESAGLGVQISEEIAQDLPCLTELFKPAIGPKAQAFEYAKGVLERGEIDLPADPPQLVAQLRNIQFEVKASGISIHGVGGAADDWPHALVYAIWGLRQEGSYVGFRDVSEIFSAHSSARSAEGGFLDSGLGLRLRQPERYDPRCPACNASVRSQSHWKAHMNSKCLLAGHEAEFKT
jgi:hypothetical protein